MLVVRGAGAVHPVDFPSWIAPSLRCRSLDVSRVETDSHRGISVVIHWPSPFRSTGQFQMILRDDGLICPYCGSVRTERKRDRGRDAVYGCDACDRAFSAPRK